MIQVHSVPNHGVCSHRTDLSLCACLGSLSQLDLAIRIEVEGRNSWQFWRRSWRRDWIIMGRLKRSGLTNIKGTSEWSQWLRSLAGTHAIIQMFREALWVEGSVYLCTSPSNNSSPKIKAKNSYSLVSSFFWEVKSCGLVHILQHYQIGREKWWKKKSLVASLRKQWSRIIKGNYIIFLIDSFKASQMPVNDMQTVFFYKA